MLNVERGVRRPRTFFARQVVKCEMENNVNVQERDATNLQPYCPLKVGAHTDATAFFRTRPPNLNEN